MALAHQVGDLAHNLGAGRDLVLVAVEGDDVAAQEDLAVQVVLQRLHHRIPGPGQLGGHLVGELELRARH